MLTTEEQIDFDMWFKRNLLVNIEKSSIDYENYYLDEIKRMSEEIFENKIIDKIKLYIQQQRKEMIDQQREVDLKMIETIEELNQQLQDVRKILKYNYL